MSDDPTPVIDEIDGLEGDVSDVTASDDDLADEPTSGVSSSEFTRLRLALEEPTEGVEGAEDPSEHADDNANH